MRLIDVDALTAEIQSMSINVSAKDCVLARIATQTIIDAVAKDKVITCVTGIIEEYSDAHVITCTVCGLPFPDYGADETVECRWCKAKSHSKAYAPSGPGYCKTSEDRKAKTFDRLFSAPSIDAVPVLHAHWTDKGSLSCRCSHCGCKANDEFPYCPHCYARMDAAGESQ